MWFYSIKTACISETVILRDIGLFEKIHKIKATVNCKLALHVTMWRVNGKGRTRESRVYSTFWLYCFIVTSNRYYCRVRVVYVLLDVLNFASYRRKWDQMPRRKVMTNVTRKLCCRKDDREMRPGCPEVSGLPDYAHGYYSQHFSWSFVPIDPMHVPTKFEVRSFTRSWDNRGYPKKLGSPWIRPRSLFSKIFNGHLFGLAL